MKSLKRLLSVFLLFFFVIGQVFPTDSRLWLIRFTSNQVVRRLPTPADRVFTISEAIRWAAGKGEGGVLFMATAKPEDKNIENSAISLNYNKCKRDGSRLQVKFGAKTIKVDGFYDWLLLPAVAYVDSGYVNGITLLGEADVNDEAEVFLTIPRLIARHDRTKRDKTIYFAEYNPVFVNTLVGYSMFLVDAFLIESNYLDPVLRSITDNLGSIKGYNDMTINKQQTAETSAKCAQRLGKLMKSANMKPATSYIYSDSEDGVTFVIKKGKLEFTGTPYYHFLKKETTPDGHSEYEFLDGEEGRNDLFNKIKEDHELIRGLNPAVFDTMERFSHLTAFFRYIKQKDPAAWDKFKKQIEDKILNSDYRQSSSDSDDKEEYNRYRYDIDQKYACPTPRSLDFLVNVTDKAYKNFKQSGGQLEKPENKYSALDEETGNFNILALDSLKQALYLELNQLQQDMFVVFSSERQNGFYGIDGNLISDNLTLERLQQLQRYLSSERSQSINEEWDFLIDYTLYGNSRLDKIK